MFRRSVLVATLIAAFAPAALLAAPEVLIVQRLSNDKNDFNVPVVQHLAEQLDIEGRVSPIVWSMLDPVFRAYIEDHKLPGFVENPDDKTIRDYAGRLRVAYVLVVEAVAKDGKVVPQAKLYEGARSRPMWSMIRDENRGKPRLVVIENGKVNEDKTQAIRDKYSGVLSEGTMAAMAVLVNGQPDWDGTAQTLARTWTRILAEGPFRDLEPQRRTFVPNADPGLGFGTETTATILPAPESGKALESAKLLAQDGKYDDAILVLRDAIDADPFNIDCRQEFARLLIKVDEPELSAQEAERAAQHLDDPGEMWALAADGWVLAGDEDKALEAANQAQARGVDSPNLLLVLGEIWLMKGDLKKSLNDYNEAIAKEPTQRSLAGRSVARASMGDVDGAIADIESAQKDGPLSAELYERLMKVVQRAQMQVADDLKTIPRKVRVEGAPSEVDEAQATRDRAAAMVEFMVRLRVPEKHKESHEVRDLAYKLLAQAAVEVLNFAKSKNEDSAMESSISLGEALKLMPKLEELFRFETKYGQ